MSGHAYRLRRVSRACLLGGSALLALMGLGAVARAQVQLPQVVVTGAKPKPKPRPVRRRAVAPPVATAAPAAPVNAATVKNNSFDAARSNLYTTIGTTSDTITHDTIQALPQGTNAPVEKVLLQAPGVSQDSAASGSIHVRNDHANVQFRINGVMLPDGVTGFGSILDPSLIGSISLITGALPAEFGMRTVGLVDITTRADIFNNSGSVSLYGGSQGTLQPSFEYGGTVGNTCPATAPVVGKAAPSASTTDCFPGVQYLFTGRYLQTTEGIENPHAFVQRHPRFLPAGKGLRLHVDLRRPGDAAKPDCRNLNQQRSKFPTSRPASWVERKCHERFRDHQFQFVAAQREPVRRHPVTACWRCSDRSTASTGSYPILPATTICTSFRTRSATSCFNGGASEITRKSYTNGIQGDASYQVDPAHTVRTGFTVSGEQTAVDNSSLVEPCVAACGTVTQVVGPDTPFTVTDDVSKTGWLAGVYAQDEWKVTHNFTINAGLRFDQMWQYVDANQLSPRVNFTYKPFEFTTFHAGYARYFTPPVLVEAAPVNIAEFSTTTLAAPPGQRNRPDAAGALALLRCRHRSERYRSHASRRPRPIAASSTSASTPITRSPKT